MWLCPGISAALLDAKDEIEPHNMGERRFKVSPK